MERTMVSIRGRELPRDDGAGRDPHALEPGGDPLGPVAEPAEGEGLAVGGDEHRVVGRRLGPAFDELPHGAGAGEYLARVLMSLPFGTTLIAAGEPSAGAAGGCARGQNGPMAKPPVHSDHLEPGEGKGKGVDRRHQATLVGVAVAGILLVWFALANLGASGSTSGSSTARRP